MADWVSVSEEHLSFSFLSALSYLRQARRLTSIQPCPEPFVSEIVLNLAKAIEILFRGENREALRVRAREWNYDRDEVDQFLIPILILRSSLDVAHPALTQLSPEQRSTVIGFSFEAIRHVEKLLLHVGTSLFAGAIRLEEPSESVEKDKSQLLKRITEYLDLSRRKGGG